MALNTAQDLISKARAVLNDTDVAMYRFSDELLLAGLNIGIADMLRLRPDIRFEFDPPADLAGSGSLISLDDQFRTALLDYVCYYAEKHDMEATDATRAALYYGGFTQRLVGQ